MEKTSKKNHSGTGLILLGILLLLSALLLVLHNRQESSAAGEASQDIMLELTDKVKSGETKAEEFAITTQMLAEVEEIIIPEMPTVEINGEWYLGYISVPDLKLELPVIAEWDFGKLNKAPCRYAGSYYTGDLVIAAHNYVDHFSPLKWVPLNTDVYLTAADGTVYHYLVDNIETVQPTQVQEMLTGDWDMTLFTCNTGGRTRCAVRCILVTDE